MSVMEKLARAKALMLKRKEGAAAAAAAGAEGASEGADAAVAAPAPAADAVEGDTPKKSSEKKQLLPSSMLLKKHK